MGKRDKHLVDVESYIYVLCEADGETVRYVGWTIGMKKRFANHMGEARRRLRCTHKNNWIFSLLGRNEIPVMRQIDVIPPNGDWVEAERRWIAHYRALGCAITNATDGGEGTPGHLVSDDTKQVIGDKNSLSDDEIAGIHELWSAGYSYNHIEESTGICCDTARKYLGKRGRRFSAITRERIRNGQVGKRPLTDEERERQVDGQVASWSRRRLPDGWTEERLSLYLLEKYHEVGSLARVAKIANGEIGTCLSARVVRRLIDYENIAIPDKCMNKRGKRRSDDSRKKQSEARKRFWNEKKHDSTETT